MGDGVTLLLVFGAFVLGFRAFFPQQTAELGLIKFPLLPVDDARISQGFKPNGEHSAIDFACPIGSVLFNVGAGTVVQVHDEIFGSSGRFVIVKGRNEFLGLAWSYSHMSSIDVVDGQDLEPGDLIGLSGNSGLTCSAGVCQENAAGSAGAHLHFAVLKVPGFTFLDPTPFLPLGQGGGE